MFAAHCCCFSVLTLLVVCCAGQTSVTPEDYTAVDFADDVRGNGHVMVAGTSTGHVAVFSMCVLLHDSGCF
mgnify:CR=1 FL=1